MAGNASDSLELLHQIVFKDHDVAHVYLTHPYDWGVLQSTDMGVSVLGKFYNPWTNLTANQLSFLRMTETGRVMVSAALEDVNIEVGNLEVLTEAIPVHAPGEAGDSITIFGSTNPATYDPITNPNVLPVLVDGTGRLQIAVVVSPPVITNKFYWEGNANSVDTVLAFGFNATETTIFNDGGFTIFYEQGAAPVPVTSPRMYSGEAMADDFVANNIHLITFGALSTPVYVPIGAPALDDMTNSGYFTGAAVTNYTVTIAATAPDSFTWSNGGAPIGPVLITGADQLLELGVNINFANLLGHTIGDSWTFTATPQTSPVRIWARG